MRCTPLRSKLKKHNGGKFAEFIARWFMRCHGYGIVARNVSGGKGTHCGEVDFIARRGKTLVFVEVKKRQTPEDAAYAIHPEQQARIRRAALNFIKRNPQYQNFDIRFDAILIVFPLYIRHIRDAWQ